MARRERSATLGLAPALPGIVLVIVIAWALAAVLMLTGTLINAREIDDTIPLINSQVSPIDKDTDDIQEAAEVARLTERIRTAAAPLSGQATRIITEARSIDRNASAIFGTAMSINETVGAIGANVASISDSVSSIGGNVSQINSRVSAIGGNVASINSSVDSIFARVGPPDATDNSINGLVGDIRATFIRLLPVTRSIDGEGTQGVEGINGRADRAINLAAGIKSDLGAVQTLVGPGAGPDKHRVAGPGTIHGHANSIDCAPLLDLGGLLGSTAYCGQ